MPRTLASIAFLVWGTLDFGGARAVVGPEPLWAYGYSEPPLATDTRPSPALVPVTGNSRAVHPTDEQMRLRHVAGSDASYSAMDVFDRSNVADWFPSDHPAMPAIIVHGPAKIGAWGCGFCHLPTGKGRPENAPVVAQSAEYFLRQLEDFRNGARMSADPQAEHSHHGGPGEDHERP